MKRALACLLSLSIALAAAACDDNRPHRCRAAVYRVVKGTGDIERHIDRVVAYGVYALVEIEQQIHHAPAEARARLVRATRRIGSPEALPLMRFLRTVEQDGTVLKELDATLAALSAKKKKK
ncbi:MAG: hypothetical protein KC503_09630 [Myxococcales bacterium]|nr:hypothetical protein [Myxococcales bacterium]